MLACGDSRRSGEQLLLQHTEVCALIPNGLRFPLKLDYRTMLDSCSIVDLDTLNEIRIMIYAKTKAMRLLCTKSYICFTLISIGTKSVGVEFEPTP